MIEFLAEADPGERDKIKAQYVAYRLMLDYH